MATDENSIVILTLCLLSENEEKNIGAAGCFCLFVFMFCCGHRIIYFKDFSLLNMIDNRLNFLAESTPFSLSVTFSCMRKDFGLRCGECRTQS